MSRSLIPSLDWPVLIAAGFGFALLVAIPELWAISRAPRRWVPVNCAPYALSDDCHYYSVLNLFHRACMAMIMRRHERLIPLAAASRLAAVTLCWNLVPYHVGYLIADRRVGVLLVRVWNHAVLFVAGGAVAYLAWPLSDREATVEAILLIAVSHYVCYPAFFTRGWRSSILFNLHSAWHGYRYGQSNDMSRGFNLASSGAMFLLAVALLIMPPADSIGPATQHGIALAANVLLYYAYLPLACVFGVLCIAHFLVDLQSAAWAGGAIALNVTVGLLYLRAAARDTVMKEVVVHREAGGAVEISRERVIEAALVLGAPALVYALTPQVSRVFLTLFAASALWVATIFLAKHQGSRFWDRGAILIYQLLLMTWGVAELRRAGVLDDTLTLLALIAATTALAVYQVRNARLLFATEATLAPAWIADLGFLDGTALRRTTIATDSLELGSYAFLYTDNHTLLKSYSIQKGGYRESLREFCESFRSAGYRLEEVQDILSTNCGYADWLEERPRYHAAASRELATLHTLQFMATYRDFNQALRDDGMYDSAGWTVKMRDLVAGIWASLAGAPESRHAVIMDPDGSVRRALAETRHRRGAHARAGEAAPESRVEESY